MDDELEKKNFKFAAETLASVWNESVIDGHAVIAKYFESEDPRAVYGDIEEEWKTCHVRTSMYFTQFVKCKNRHCCAKFRSTWLQVFPDRFLPPPILYVRDHFGVEVVQQGDEQEKFRPVPVRMTLRNIDPLPQKFIRLPYDYYCSSVEKNLVKMCCKRCGIYHATQVAVKSHECEVPSEQNEKDVDEMDDAMEFQTELSPELPEAGSNGPELIHDMTQWIRSGYVNVDIQEEEDD